MVLNIELSPTVNGGIGLPRPSSRHRAQPSPHDLFKLAHEFRIPRRPPRLQAFASPLDDRLATTGGKIGTPTGDRPAHRDARHPVQRPTRITLDDKHRVRLPHHVASGARPGIVLGPLDEPCPHRVRLNKADFFEDARIVEDAGQEPPPPELAARVLFLMKVLGISHVEGVERPGEPAARPRDAYVVDVGGHQAVGPDIDAVALFAFTEPVEVAVVVRVLLEDRLLAVPSLADRMRVAEQDGAGETGHVDKLPPMDAVGRLGGTDTSDHQPQRLFTGGRPGPESIKRRVWLRTAS